MLLQEPRILNLGLCSFADAISQAGGKVTEIAWAPPAAGDDAAGRALAGLINHPVVEAANRVAFDAYLAAQPRLEGVGIASKVMPSLRPKLLLHSGPPIAWERMAGPVRGAIVGAVLFEGWANDPDGALKIIERGDVAFEPCHHHGAVGPMAGIISPSMPVWIIRETNSGRCTFSNLNEGIGKVLRFGANDPAVIERLRWMASALCGVLEATFDELRGVDIKPLIAQALHMGDECHNRNVAATALLSKRLLPSMMRSKASREDIAASLEFIGATDHFSLNISMAACKLMLDAARDVAGSSMVTAMARNGVEFGIQLSGTGDRWFVAPAPIVDGLFFPGYSMKDAACDLGDSAITETAGLGAFAMAAAPAIISWVGGSAEDVIATTVAMGHICLGRNTAFTLPAMNFVGTPAGIDARKVVDTGLLPIINTGIAHREPGIGQIGAGITHAPLLCFTQAVQALNITLGGKFVEE
jgi:hypothetical protein